MGIVSEIQISYKNQIDLFDLYKIKSSSDAAKLLFDHWNKDTIELNECFKVLLLNNSNIVKGIYEVSSGGITGTVVDVRMLFAVALKTLSTSIIIAHNHPSGNLNPSEADKSLTKKIQKGSQFLDIKLLDHLIIVPSGSYFSFCDEGIF